MPASPATNDTPDRLAARRRNDRRLPLASHGLGRSRFPAAAFLFGSLESSAIAGTFGTDEDREPMPAVYVEARLGLPVPVITTRLMLIPEDAV